MKKSSSVSQFDNLLLGLENGWLAASNAELLREPAGQTSLRKVSKLFASRLSEEKVSRALVVPHNLDARKRMVSAIMAARPELSSRMRVSFKADAPLESADVEVLIRELIRLGVLGSK
jgi:hypothetical protein